MKRLVDGFVTLLIVVAAGTVVLRVVWFRWETASVNGRIAALTQFDDEIRDYETPIVDPDLYTDITKTARSALGDCSAMTYLIVGARSGCTSCLDAVRAFAVQLPARLCNEIWVVATDGDRDVIEQAEAILISSEHTYRLRVPMAPEVFSLVSGLSAPMVVVARSPRKLRALVFGAPTSSDLFAIERLWLDERPESADARPFFAIGSSQPGEAPPTIPTPIQ